MPENLRVPATQTLALSVQARGGQIYECGGKAPVDGCNQAQLGKIARVNYRAIYNFYVGIP